MSNFLGPHGLYSPWHSLSQITGVGSLSLLQGIFPTQGSNPGLPHCRWILYQLSHKGSPRILEWVAYPFSSTSFQPRNWTRVSCIAGGFFTNWAIREALKDIPYHLNRCRKAFDKIPCPFMIKTQSIKAIYLIALYSKGYIWSKGYVWQTPN